MGQTRDVLVYRLLADDTIDERMLEILSGKQKEFDSFADESVIGDGQLEAEKAEEGTTLLTVTENGFGTRTPLEEYLRTGPEGTKIPQARGGKGLKNYNITDKTGIVAGCCLVSDTDDVMLIENGGVIIRVPASSINVYKRDVQGVIIMRVEEGNKMVAVKRVSAEEEETAE